MVFDVYYSDPAKIPQRMVNFSPQYETFKDSVSSSLRTIPPVSSTRTTGLCELVTDTNRQLSGMEYDTHNFMNYQQNPRSQQQYYQHSVQYQDLHVTRSNLYPWANTTRDQLENIACKNSSTTETSIPSSDIPMPLIKKSLTSNAATYPISSRHNQEAQSFAEQAFPPVNAINSSFLDDSSQQLTTLVKKSTQNNVTFKPTETKVNENPRIHTIDSSRPISKFTNLSEKLGEHVIKHDSLVSHSTVSPYEFRGDRIFFDLRKTMGLQTKSFSAMVLDEVECHAFNVYLHLVAEMIDIYFPFPLFQAFGEVSLYESSSMILHSILALGTLYLGGDGYSIAKSYHSSSETTRRTLLKSSWDSGQEIQARILLAAVMNCVYNLFIESTEVTLCVQDAVSILENSRDMENSGFHDICFWGLFVCELLNLFKHPLTQCAIKIGNNHLLKYRETEFYAQQASKTQWLRKAVYNFRTVMASYSLSRTSYSILEMNLQELEFCLNQFHRKLPRQFKPVIYSFDHRNGILVYFRDETCALVMVYTQISWLVLEQMKPIPDGLHVNRVLQNILGVLSVYNRNSIVGMTGKYILEYIDRFLASGNNKLSHKVKSLKAELRQRFGANHENNKH